MIKNKLNELWWEKINSAQCMSLHFCVRWLCFWCEIPRDPYMVKAKRECEAEGSVSCYHSRRLIAGKQSIFQAKPGE